MSHTSCNFRLEGGTLISDLILQSASHSRTYNVNQGQGPDDSEVLWKPLSKGYWDTILHKFNKMCISESLNVFPV